MRSELTSRELLILSLIKLGYEDKEIAQRLNLAIGTVKNHLQVIYRKLRVFNRTAAVIKALEKGYISVGRVQ